MSANNTRTRLKSERKKRATKERGDACEFKPRD